MPPRKPPRRRTTAPDDRILTPGEVARYYRVDPQTVTRWADTGKLPGFRTPTGHYRFYASEIHKAPPPGNDTGTRPGDSPAPGTATPKHAQAAARIRAQIANGLLAPGQPAPSGAELARLTGYSALTCRKALQTLIEDGALVPGTSPTARPRVPAPAQHGAADTARALSAALAARRRAAGLTQPQLAARIGVSTTTIGHAETSRHWHARTFWEHTDKELSADGELLRLHDAHRAATVPPAPEPEPEQQAQPDRQPAPATPAETTPAPPPPELLTPDEHEALRQAGLLYTMIAGRIIADGPTRDDDLAEIRTAIHLIQRAVLAQAAARAYPREFQKLRTATTTQNDATNPHPAQTGNHPENGP